MAEDLEAYADEVLASFLEGVRREGWRASKEWIEQVHGKPQQTVVTEDGQNKAASELTLRDLEQLRAKLLSDSGVPSIGKANIDAG
jgi:hypothetical protein